MVTLTCKQVVQLLSSKIDQYPFLKRVQIRFHLLMCHHCSIYLKQLLFMKAAFQNFFITDQDKESKEVVKKIEESIINKLHLK